MTFESLKELCDNINVTFKNNLMYYHKEIIGRFYFAGCKFVCDIIVIGSMKPAERLDNETEIEQYLINAIKYFKKMEINQRLKRIENDF